MSSAFIIGIFVLLGIIALGLFILIFLRRGRGAASDSTLLVLQNQINEIARMMDSRLGESHRSMQESVKTQFFESQRLLREINQQMRQSLVDVTKEQTKANEATRQFVTIAEQLGNLEKTLKHQKQRGNWGELSLELVLSNNLAPGDYLMQYEFENREKVDAVIKTREGLIPIDAKFSLDNYSRITQAINERQKEELEKEFRNDLKKRIDETAKYIRPDEGTLSFAFMYIPAEGIYYDLLINEVGAGVSARNLIDYAYNEKKVVIVSPTTFMAYLKSVLYGFKAFKIEEATKVIVKQVDELGKHLKVYEDYMLKVGNSLGTTVSHYNKAYKELGKVNKDVTRIAGESPGIEPSLVIDNKVIREKRNQNI